MPMKALDFFLDMRWVLLSQACKNAGSKAQATVRVYGKRGATTNALPRARSNQAANGLLHPSANRCCLASARHRQQTLSNLHALNIQAALPPWGKLNRSSERLSR